MENTTENKRKSTLVADIIILLLLMISIGAVILLLKDKEDLEYQINKRDKLISDKRTSDSLLCMQNQKNERIIEKYISECGITINGKNVSTDELLKYLRNQINEINNLNLKSYLLQDSLRRERIRYEIEKNYRSQFQTQLKIAYDSLGVYKAFYSLAKSNFKTDFSVDGNKVRIQVPEDSSLIYKKLYELAKKDYGINYDIRKEGNYIVYSKNFSTLDSALMIFEYYKDKLSKDTLNNIWYIETPKRKRKSKN